MVQSFNLSVTRQSGSHDYDSTAMSQYIISTFAEMSLSQILDGIVSSKSPGR
jgi:hypothetical protein